MVSPEARVQFSDSQRFKELSAILPIVRKQGARGEGIRKAAKLTTSSLQCKTQV